MNAQRRRFFLRRLNEEQARLTSTIRALETEAELDVIEAAPEREDAGSALTDAETAEATASMELGQLREVESAIARLRNDPQHYGHCVTCGCEIGASRLELVPWARHCVTHAAAPHRSAESLGREGPPVLE